MRYDDYQSLVKRYKKVIKSKRFRFLERRYRRLKKRGHPRKYIRIRKYNKGKQILFELNPFVERNRKNEKWKVYFDVWYNLSYYMRQQLILWSSMKAWKLFHVRKNVRRAFFLKKKWLRLMYNFYEYRFIRSFYNVCFLAYSQCVSKAQSKRLRKFIKKYIRSLRWDVNKLLRRKRKYRRSRVYKRTAGKGLFKWYKRGGRKAKARYHKVISTLASYKNKLIKKWIVKSLQFYRYKRNKLKSRQMRRLPRLIYKKRLKSKTFRGVFALNTKHLGRYTDARLNVFKNRLIQRVRPNKLTKYRKLRLTQATNIIDNRLVYSLGTGNTIDVSKLNASLRYAILCLVYLTNTGEYRACNLIARYLNKLEKKQQTYSSLESLLRRLSYVWNNKAPRRKRRRVKKYNILRNRREALSKISKYLKLRPVLIPIFSQYVKKYKKEVLLEIFKYKQIKTQLNDYQKDNYILYLRRRLQRLRSLKRKLRRLRRAMSRVKRLGGILKSWFIVRLTSKYRKVLIRIKKYMKFVVPRLRSTLTTLKTPVYNNYNLLYFLLCLKHIHYFFNSYVKNYIMQIIMLYCYVCRNHVGKEYCKLHNNRISNIKLFFHHYTYLNA